MKKRSIQSLALTSVLLLGTSLTAEAATTADLTIGDDTSRAGYGFAGTLPGGSLQGSGLYGIYSFTTANAGAGIPGSFWSTCLSPAGEYANGNYTELTYAQANPGINPNQWASSGGLDYGIQNAQYLWREYGNVIVTSGTADQGAGLAMAMYEALYDSTGYGVIGSPNANFKVTTWVGNSQHWYNTYIAEMLGAGEASKVLANWADGYVLVPTTDVTWTGNNPTIKGAGQEFILNFTAVPEPTTMIAGALLLLPFGASTLRILRKNRTA